MNKLAAPIALARDKVARRAAGSGFCYAKMLVAGAKWPIIRIRRRPIVTVALRATEGCNRPLLNAELNCRTIRAKRADALAGIRDLIVWLSKRIVAVGIGPNVFLRERRGGGRGQRNCGRCKYGSRR
jgi:hypothetical protein